MNKKIIFVHSLNNFTGSPNILSLIIREFIAKGYNIDLITNKSYGFLSDIDNVNYRYTSYKWSKSRLLTLVLLIWSQIETFFIILIHYRKEKCLFYINTIVPFGAAWACKVLKRDVVYHVHENMNLSKPMYPIYRFTYNICRQKSIFVSKYLQETSNTKDNSIIVYNSLSTDFLNKVELWNRNCNNNQNIVVMISSLRVFKGIFEFVELSKRFPQYSFELVLSASSLEIENFKIQANPPFNLTIFSQQTNLHPFYQRAKILLQLSHPDAWVETFGLTILEAMVYGIPAIVPNIGGPIELIENGVNGYTVDPLNLDILVEKVKILMENNDVYSKFSNAAIKKSMQFDHNLMITKIEKYITE